MIVSPIYRLCSKIYKKAISINTTHEKFVENLLKWPDGCFKTASNKASRYLKALFYLRWDGEIGFSELLGGPADRLNEMPLSAPPKFCQLILEFTSRYGAGLSEIPLLHLCTNQVIIT